MGLKGIIFDLKKYTIHDGPGIRTTVFFKGCPLKCSWCHNPESQKMDPEIITKINRKKILNLSYSETTDYIGREVSLEEIMAEIEKDIIYYDESEGGVTFSGGEPLMQAEFLFSLLTECKKKEIKTAVDTSGYANPESFKNISGLVDVFLFDLKIMDEKKHLEYTGVSNKIILENLKRISENGNHIVIRIPVIPGITDSDDNIDQIINFISTIKIIRDINILPYNRLGEDKYKRLNFTNVTQNLQPPEEEQMERIKEKFVKKGFNIKIGG